MKKVCVTRSGWWERVGATSWVTYIPTREEVARVGGDLGVFDLYDDDQAYVLACIKALGITWSGEGEVELPLGFQSTRPIAGSWSDMADVFRRGVYQIRPWVLEGGR